MTSLHAPLWAFTAEAMDGVGDTHLPPGIHVRALPATRLGVPATPLVVTRSMLTSTMVQPVGRTDGVTWIDSHGATLALPFNVTPDNPVYGYFPVPNVIFAQLTASTTGVSRTALAASAAPDVLSVLGAARPIGAQTAAPSETLEQVRDVVEMHATQIVAATTATLRFEALANSALGLAPFQARQQPPYVLAAWTIPLVRVVGQGTVQGIFWLDASRLRASDETLWELWSLPIAAPAPRYRPTANARPDAIDRVNRAGVTHQPMYVAYTAASPGSAPVAAAGDALARVAQVNSQINRWLAILLNDVTHETWDVNDTQPITDHDGEVEVPIEPFLLGSAIDPDVGHYLGFGDVDNKAVLPSGALVFYRVRGLWRWRPARWSIAERPAFSSGIRATLADAVQQFPELNQYGIAPTEQGPFLDLHAIGVAVVGSPPSSLAPISFDLAEDRGWLATPPPPNVRRAVRLVASGFLPHPVAALAATDGSGDRTLHPFPGIGRVTVGQAPPKGTPLPLVVSRPQDAAMPGQGRFEDRDAPASQVLYRLAPGDWFGRWGAWRTRTSPARPRTPPMPPTIELYPQPPFAPPMAGPAAGTIEIRIPIPRIPDLPAGGSQLLRLDLDESFAGSPTSTTSYILAALAGATIEPHPAPEHDVLKIQRSGPALQPSGTRHISYTARWIDQLNLISPNAHPAARTIVDPRPPLPPAVTTELRYTARPDAQGHARVDLDFTSTPNTRYRVFATTETTLLAALDSSDPGLANAIRNAQAGAPRAMLFKANKASFTWDHFECLTRESILATDTTTHFTHRVSGSLEVLAIYRVLSEGESGALSDMASADLVPFAVPNFGPPPRPQIAVLNAGLDPITQGAKLRVKVPKGRATPRAWRLRRASVPVNDPLRMLVVAQDLLPVALADEGESLSFEINAADPLMAWRQYRFCVEVQADDPPGAPSVGTVLPGEWSQASAPATLIVVPAAPPLPPTSVQIATTASGLDITITHPAADTLIGTSMGPYRFEYWRIEPGQRPERRDVDFRRGAGNTWVGSDSDVPPKDTYVAVRIIDPIGRSSDGSVSNQVK